MDFYNQMANPLQQWMRMQQGINAIHQLKTYAKDAMNKGDYRKALDLYSQTIGITNVFPTPHEEVANLYCNRSLAFYNLELYPDSLSDAAQSISIIPNFVQGYYRQGMALKCLNMPVEAAGCFINAINSCRHEEQNHYQITCYRELILLLCDIEDISDLESPVPKTYAMKKEILQQLVSKRSWKAVSYVLLGAITGADSALAGTFSDFDCSFTSIFELLQETSDEQKRKWACKLAVKLFSNGASFAEFEKNINGNVIHFGIELALKLGDVDFLKYLLSASKNKDSVDENGDTGLHVIVKKQEVRKSTLGETIVGLLVNHGCRVDIKDSSGNKPIDYTSETEQVYSLLQSKKTMDVGIFGKIDSLREEGKKSLNENKLETALGIYNEVIKLCLGKPELTKEAAKFYTNRANVFSKLQQNEAALKDAEDAIKIDPSWRKAYWRKGKELCFLQRYDEAFDFFIQMISSIKNNDCDENEHKDLIDFVVETAITFPRITENKFQKYKHMFTIPTSLWSQVLVRLSKNAEWAAIRYLILGLTTDIPPHRGHGVASSADTNRMNFMTVFRILDHDKSDIKTWLTPTLVVLLFKHNGNYLNFRNGEKDTCVHAAVRYALITGDVRLLEDMPIEGKAFLDEYLNDDYESPFHITNDVNVMEKVASVLVKKKFTASMKDKSGKLPLDYSSLAKHGKLNEMLKQLSFQKSSKSKQCKSTTTSDDTAAFNEYLDLKEKGNKEYYMGSLLAAQELYSKALSISDNTQNKLFSRHNSELFQNLIGCHLKMKQVQAAYDTAKKYMIYKPDSYEAQYLMGEVLATQNDHEGAFNAYLRVVALVKNTNQRSRRTDIEILTKICTQYINLNRESDLNDLKNVQNTFDFTVWVHVMYTFISQKNSDAVRFVQHQMKNVPQIKFIAAYELPPICDIEFLKQLPDCIVFIVYLLQMGSDHSTLSTQRGDTYLHAAVRMTLSTVNKGICLRYRISFKPGTGSTQTSSGETNGMVVGIVLGVILLGVLIKFCLTASRKQQRPRSSPVSERCVNQQPVRY